MTTDETSALFRKHFVAAHAIGRRLLLSKSEIEPLLPIDPDRFDEAPPSELNIYDAFMKRFENFQDSLQGPIFRGVAVLEAFDQPKTPRDLIDLMEKLGIVEDADAWFKLRKLRNVLAHEYPNDRATQADRLSEACAAIDTMMLVLERVRAYVTERGLADLSGLPPLRG